MDTNRTIKERVLFFIDQKNIKRVTFYRDVEMSASMFKGARLQSDLGVEKLGKILKTYPELNEKNNLTWLITGEGKLNLEKEDDQTAADSFDSIGDLLAGLYAQYNLQSNNSNFIISKLNQIAKSVNDLSKKVDLLSEEKKYND